MKDFKGASGVLRFRDGAVEAEFASAGLGQAVGGPAGGGPDAGTLPATTAAVLSVALRDGWLDESFDSVQLAARRPARLGARPGASSRPVSSSPRT